MFWPVAALSLLVVAAATYALQAGVIVGIASWVSLSTAGIGAVIIAWGIINYSRDRYPFVTSAFAGLTLVFLSLVTAYGFWIAFPVGVGTTLVITAIKVKGNTPQV